MVHSLVKTTLVTAFVYGSSAMASIVPYTQNPDVAPGIAAYNPTTASAWPTPFNDPASNPPAVRTQFTAGEDVSIAEMVDLQALAQATDETYGDANTFEWSVFWYDTLDPLATHVFDSFYEVSWADITSWQASGFEALAYWTDAYKPAAGNWIADTYFEGNYSNSVTFDVPEPSSVFLLSLGVLGVVAGKRKAEKAAA
ncbi:MAG: PEP-CTERM sorting domain-containing protein [Pseudomonadales bacterium]